MRPFSVLHLPDRPPARDIVVVIDVIRAFTTAAAAFTAGADRILCVETVDQAFALREPYPNAVLMGEVEGSRPAGFDLGNSPVEVAKADLNRATVIQRTSNGTRGLAATDTTDPILAMAATNVSASARWILDSARHVSVTALCTGNTSEDGACADFLGELLAGEIPDPAWLTAAVISAAHEHRALWRNPNDQKHAGFADDITMCSDVDRYDFAMVGRLTPAAVELRTVPA
jgi:2-phosphosulfolactate phosphatase